MSLKLKHTQTSKRWHGMGIVGLLILLSSSAAYGQFSGQCSREVFVGNIAGFGGTAVGIAMDAQDNLYIANNVGASQPGPIVSKVTPQGVISIVVPLGILGDVTALAVDAQGNLYVADGNGNGNGGQPLPKNMVWKVDSNGSITPFILGINNPTGLAFDSAQNLYVASYTDRSVYKYSTSGTFLGVVTNNLQEAPYGIAVDASGNLFVGGFSANGAVPAGAWGQRIYKVTPQGERSLFVDPGFPDPYSLVFDKQGYLYASYYNGLKILRIAPDGSYTTFPGGCVGDDAANGLAIDSHGTLYAVVNGARTTAQQAVLKIYGVVPGSSPGLFIPGDMRLTTDSHMGRVVNYTATAVDQNFAPATVTCSYPSGSVFPIGTTPVTCTAVDSAGHISSGTFHITLLYGAPSGQCTANVFVEGTIGGTGGSAAGLAIDAQDNLYIADGIGDTSYIQGPLVSKVTPQGAISLVVPPGILGNVTALAHDAQGNLYVADGNGIRNGAKHMVWKVDADGAITPFITGINNPTGLAFDAAQNLYVASFGDYAVYKYSSTGAFLGVVTEDLPSAPYGIAIDSSGNLFVAGFGQGSRDGGSWGTQIYKVTPQGQRSVFVDPGFPDPHSLVFDNQGYLYASYYNSLKILRIAPDGSYIVFPGGCSEDDAANGLAIDSNGTLYAVVNGARTTGQQAVLKIYGVVPGSSAPNPSFPQLTNPGNMLFAAESPSGRVANYTAAAVDQNFAPAAVTCDYPSGSIFPLGTTPVTCTATDGAGHSSAPGTFYITVVDTPPNLSLPSYISISSTSSTGAQVDYFASADDAVSGQLPVQCNPASGTTFSIGTTTVNCSATDGAGYTTTGSFKVYVLGVDQSFTPPDYYVTVQPTNGPTINFEQVDGAGVTTVTPIDAGTIGATPAGFALSNGIAYQISTTATFSGVVSLDFAVPGPISEADFNNLSILHNSHGTLEDVTAGRSYDPQKQSGTIAAYTYSFSPFYLAKRVSTRIAALFDQTKAFKSGSTIPVKLQLLSEANSNISASTTPLKARNIVRLGTNTTAAVTDAGNANPDFDFRYDASLRGYIFNLSTKGLASGQYALSFYVGSDHSFFYTAKFEVR